MTNKTGICVLTTIILTVVVVYGLLDAAINKRINKAEIEIQGLVSKQEETLNALTKAMEQNKFDSVTGTVIKDCALTKRGRFEELLGRLSDGLSDNELDELDRLFGRCGYFFADSKAMMSTRLEREVEVYQSYVTVLAAVTNQPDLLNEFSLKQWIDLADKESKQSRLYSDLVNQQEQIITALRAGKKPDSPEIRDILLQVKEIKENLILLNKQIKDLRKTLTP